jgi:pyridoxine kinase
MARILAISSQTVFGPVGNSAAVPALQEQGHDVIAIPTTLLSHHPGLGRPIGRTTDPQLFEDFLTRLDDMGILETCDAVSTGYFAAAEQVDLTANTISRLKKQNSNLVVLVDPVLGDNNALYVPQAVAIAIRNHLLPLATIATPNRFELGWLTGSDPQSEMAFAEIANSLAVTELVVTSAIVNESAITTLHIADDMVSRHDMANLPRVPNGTGDFLAGQYLAHRFGMAAIDAFHAAMKRVEHAVTVSAGQKILHLGRA